MSTQKMLEAYHKMPTNFVTPKVLKFHSKGNTIIELSVGYGFITKTALWGVSELVYTNKTRYGFETTENGKCFNSPKEARAYYQLLLNNN